MKTTITWKPIRTVPDEMIGRSILVWVPKIRSVFAVVPYGSHGTELQWWGADSPSRFNFPHRATHWLSMPAPPVKKRARR